MMVKPLSGCVFKQRMSWTYYKLGGWLTLESDRVRGVQYFLILHVQYEGKCGLSVITVHMHPQVLL